VLVNGKAPGNTASSIGYVPQNVHINQSFPISALDVVLMGAFDPKKRFRRNLVKQKKAALEALDRLEMGSYSNKKIGTLSGGQRQRVLIARALVSKPELLLLDEPTASIDTKGQAEFYELLARLNKEITILVVSHDLLVISRYVNAVACVNKVTSESFFRINGCITMIRLKLQEICWRPCILAQWRKNVRLNWLHTVFRTGC